MPYTLEDFRRDSARSLLNSFTPEEILTHYKLERLLSGLAPEEVVTHYKPEQRLSGLALEDILAGLSAKDQERLKLLANKQAAGSSVN